MDKIVGLNTLRFFAFLAIFLFHTTSYFKYGYLGVDFFFVLSSFLLTYLACVELKNTQTFSKKNFFVRRALRIFPLYFLVIAFSFLLLPLLSTSLGISPQLPKNKLLYWSFLSNYEVSDCVYFLKFLWSIAVEEQFYLLFLLLSFLIYRKIYLLVGALIVSYFIFMLLAPNYNIPVYSNTITHFSNFSIGILSGFLFFRKYNLRVVALITLGITTVGFFLFNQPILFHLNSSLFFASLLWLFIELATHLKNFQLFKLTENLGTYTYGLYVYSGIVITLISKNDLINNSILKLTTELIVVLIMAITSYHLYEKQFLKLKNRFR